MKQVHGQAVVGHLAAVHDRDTVALRKQLQLMCDEDDCLVLEHAFNALVKDVCRRVLVDGAQRIVEQHDVTVVVDSAREADALTLATREVNPTLTCE